MPCLFGGVGCDPAVLDKLEAEFSSIWEIRVRKMGEGSRMGGHAFHPSGPVVQLAGEAILGFDGEASFNAAFVGIKERGDLPAKVEADGISLTTPFVGNLAVIDRETLWLATDWTGSVPLFYLKIGGGLLFSSHLRPLARVVDGVMDQVGVLQFLRDGYTIGKRTQFRGVSRLLGGQSLRFSPELGVRITEHSKAWAGEDERLGNLATASREAQAALEGAYRDLPEVEHPPALMMSAGWDSRTLLALASMRRDHEHLTCYSHGDPASRELRLARMLAESRGKVSRTEPLDSRLYEPDLLSSSFARTETAVFPHWHRAGAVLAEEGVGLILAGVFGEMLGGRYWAAHATSGVRKGLTLFSELMRRTRRSPSPQQEERARVLEIFRWASLPDDWYLDDEMRSDGESALAQVNGDIEEAIDRYRSRGALTRDLLSEAFQGEHIGGRYCNVQLLSCRSHTDVAFPLADRRVLSIATRTPIHTRMQNQLNRQIIGNLDPEILRFPMAATLLPASAPIIIQELSRVVRKGIEEGGWALHFASDRRIPPTRLGWGNYEFLRNGAELRRVVEDLRCGIWNLPELHRFVDDVSKGRWDQRMLPFAYLLGRILTTDMLLR